MIDMADAPSFQSKQLEIRHNRKQANFMNRKLFVSNAILWAAAIIASAILGAPTFFTTVLLPALAGSALFVTWPKSRASGCGW